MGYIVAFLLGVMIGGFTIIALSVVVMEKDERGGKNDGERT